MEMSRLKILRQESSEIRTPKIQVALHKVVLKKDEKKTKRNIRNVIRQFFVRSVKPLARFV